MEPVKSIHPWRWRALTFWIVAFTLLQAWQYGSVQKSRKESCERNYRTLQLVIDAAYGEPQTRNGIESKERALAVASPVVCNLIRLPFWVRD